MTMKEKLEMHKQIEQEDKEARKAFLEKGIIGLRYQGDNMPLTFQKGDRLYIRKRRFGADGDIVAVKLPDIGYYVARFYSGPDESFTLVDEKNPPKILTEVELLGTVVGYERIF